VFQTTLIFIVEYVKGILFSLILFNLFINDILDNCDKHCVFIEKEIRVFKIYLLIILFLIVLIKKMKLSLRQISNVRYNKKNNFE